MSKQLQSYFHAEKASALITMVLGVAGILIGTVFVATGVRFIDAAYPLILFGGLQLGIGAFVWLRTDAQREQLQKLFAEDPLTYAQQEGTRMQRVLLHFKFYRWAEIALLLTGFWLSFSYLAKALGVGLVIEASILLLIDGLAETRAQAYAAFIRAVEQPEKKKTNHAQSARPARTTRRRTRVNTRKE